MACVQITKSDEYKNINYLLETSGLDFNIIHTVSGVEMEEVIKFGMYVWMNQKSTCREDYIHDYIQKWTWFFGQGNWNMIDVYESSRYVYQIMKKLSSL